MSSVPVEKFQLHVPSLEEVQQVLSRFLLDNFADVSVTIVDCPDLTAAPYGLARPGLCGSPRVIDIGGISYIMPSPEMDKIYNLRDVSQWTDMPGDLLMIGAGGTANESDGSLSEMIINASIQDSKIIDNRSRSCRVDHAKNGEYVLEKMKECEARHLTNLYISEGKPGKVLEVRARNRTGALHFIQCLQLALKAEYSTRPVGLGGTFLLKNGKAHIHVMPGYSATPLTCAEHVDTWLKFYEMSSPLVVLGYLVSHDPGFRLRMEHFHCYSEHGDGGHFHYDTTPQEAEYIGYFNVPEYLYRVDRWGDDHFTVDYAE